MKKYTNKHLESVPPGFIVAIEKTVEMLRKGNDTIYTCPSIIAGGHYWEHNDCGRGDQWCPKYLLYPYRGAGCPCYVFGPKKSIKLLNNLIKQWKRWAEGSRTYLKTEE
jgi:hypothetical protein